ncbi:MAG TPA: DUF4258 domain-containing protein [Ktedonobacterales bacterium]
MPFSRLVFRVHALRRIAQRSISIAEVRQVLTTGTVIEDYPQDTPYPSYLMLGIVAGRPLHVVAGDNVADQETIVITTYEPDPSQWTPDFTRRRP